MSDQTLFSSAGFLRLPEILKLIPVSKATWWNGCKSGVYPKPYKLGPNITAWKVADIHKCIERFPSANNQTDHHE